MGKLQEIYFDPRTGRPAYACVKAGLLGRRLQFVSLAGAALGQGYVRIVQTHAEVKQAPSLRPELQLTSGQARQLSEYYATSPSLRTGHAESSAAARLVDPGVAASASGTDLLERLDSLERRVAELQRTLG